MHTPLLTNELIREIAIATESAEPGRDGYILPNTFARAIEAAVIKQLSDSAVAGTPKGWLIRSEENGELSVFAPEGNPGMIYVKSTAKALPERLLFALAQALLTAPTETQQPVAA